MKRLLRLLWRGLVILAGGLGFAMLAVLAVLWITGKREAALRPQHEFAPSPWPPQPVASDEQPQPLAETPASITVDGVEWTRDEIRELRDTLQNDTIHTLMQKLRDRGDAPVNFREVVDSSPRNTAQVRADLSKLSRISKSIGPHTSWPLRDAQPTDGDSRKAYQIPPQYLDWWFEE